MLTKLVSCCFQGNNPCCFRVSLPSPVAILKSFPFPHVVTFVGGHLHLLNMGQSSSVKSRYVKAYMKILANLVQTNQSFSFAVYILSTVHQCTTWLFSAELSTLILPHSFSYSNNNVFFVIIGSLLFSGNGEDCFWAFSCIINTIS